jgi:hypothetical protein
MDPCTATPEDMDCPQCSICTDLITAETGQVKLACSHTFHLGCIARWTTRGASNCPMCRAELTEKEQIEDDTISSISFSEDAPADRSAEFLSRYLGIDIGRAQIYLDTFNGNYDDAIEYVRYVRANHTNPFYIPPLERLHRPPVLPDQGFFRDKDFARKRHWLRYSKSAQHYLDRGYDTE